LQFRDDFFIQDNVILTVVTLKDRAKFLLEIFLNKIYEELLPCLERTFTSVITDLRNKIYQLN
jgi:hypothetical protein